jgi:hypothetical protein
MQSAQLSALYEIPASLSKIFHLGLQPFSWLAHLIGRTSRFHQEERMPTHKQTLAIVFLAAAAVLAHAEEAAKKDPKTGKNCVTLASSDPTDNRGLVRMNFRNICASPFQIGKVASSRVRPKSRPRPLSIASRVSAANLPSGSTRRGFPEKLQLT